MRKIIFLDRDGVLNKEIGDYVSRKEDFEILKYNIAALKKYSILGYEFVIITNQGGIAKGLYNEALVAYFHSLIKNEFQNQGIDLLDDFYCKHHPLVGNCLCRKPDSIMIEKAISKYNVNKELSVMIGDNERDILAANKAGIRGIQIQSNDDISLLQII